MASPEEDYGIIAADIRRLITMLSVIGEELGGAATGNRAERFVAREIRQKLRDLLGMMEVLPRR